MTPLVGREQEVGLLLERWQQAKTGQGQIILLSGEAGIGKSRLVQVLKDHLADALLMANAESWNTCVNRLYYSCFYAVSALLVRDGLSSSRHTGIRSLFNQHYVRTGVVPRDLARLYNDLFERRQESDYADFVRFQADQVRPWIPQTEAFIAHMTSLLNPENPQTDSQG